MKKTVFYRIYTAGAIFGFLAAAGVFLALQPENADNVVSVPWTIAADAFLPLLLFGCAAAFGSRICAAAAFLAALLTMILRLAGWVIFRETFMPLGWTTFSLLAEHTDETSLRVFLGKNYGFWLIPALAAAAGFAFFGAFFAWKSDFPSRKKNPAAVAVFCVLLAAALAGNIDYLHVVRQHRGTFFAGSAVRPLLFLGAEAAGKTVRALFGGRSGERPGFFPGKLGEKSRTILKRRGVFRERSDRDLLQEKTPRFDRILIVALESVDLDFIASLNPAMPRNVTPVLDGLFARYPHLVRFYCGGQPTSWALDSLLSSRFDYRSDVQFYRNESLPSVAAEKGFDTAYYSGCRGSFGDNRVRYQKLFRFREVFFMEEWEKKHPGIARSEWGIPDGELFRCVLTELKKKKNRKFLAVVSTMDTHPLYHSDRPFGNGDEPFLNALHGADHNLGVFLDAVMHDPELYDDRTLIVVTADHTATHGRNFLARKNFTPEKIPLVFIATDPAVFRDVPQDRCASGIDFAPTIVHLLGEPIPETFMGQDLRMPRDVAVSRSLDNVLLLRDGNGEKIVDLNQIPEDPEARAFYDYYYSFYEK